MSRLLIYAEEWGIGGIENFILNSLSCIDRNKITVDLLTATSNTSVFDSRLSEYGVQRYVACGDKSKVSYLTRTLRASSALKDLLRKNNYDVVHIHVMNAVGLRIAKIAKQMGVQSVIVHSHNTDVGVRLQLLKRLVHCLARIRYGKYPDFKLACSIPAGLHMYVDGDFLVLKNGIDIARFRYSDELRRKLRSELEIGEFEFVIGCVARQTIEKNLSLLLYVLKSVLDRGIDARLLLAGNGVEHERLIELATELRVLSRVSFLDADTDVASVNSALDVYCLPSLFEGNAAPIATLEAVAAELDCLLSENVPGRENCDQLHYLPLEQVEKWVDVVEQFRQNPRDRRGTSGASWLDQNGFNILQVVSHLEALYLGGDPKLDMIE